MDRPGIRILGKASSINVRKVLWACDELGIDYEREDWGEGFRDTRSEEYVALNPNALVPVLIEDDFVLWESNVIVRYLAASSNATALLPNDPRQRAEVEQWMDWQAGEFNNSWRYAFQALVRKNPDFSDQVQLAASLDSWAAHVGILNARLEKTGSYVAGKSFTVADIPVGLAVNRWFLTPIEDRPAFDAVSAYYDRLGARPASMLHGRNGTP